MWDRIWIVIVALAALGSTCPANRGYRVRFAYEQTRPVHVYVIPWETFEANDGMMNDDAMLAPYDRGSVADVMFVREPHAAVIWVCADGSRDSAEVSPGSAAERAIAVSCQ